jgi:hypothetical protein
MASVERHSFVAVVKVSSIAHRHARGARPGKRRCMGASVVSRRVGSCGDVGLNCARSPSSEELSMTRAQITFLSLLALPCAALPRLADAGCGCDKPPPPRTEVRPFVASPGQRVTLFHEELEPGGRYQVEFVSPLTGARDWSQGRGRRVHDLADGAIRAQLVVAVPEVSFGPVAITVWHRGEVVMAVADDAFTLAAPPIPLHDFAEAVTRQGYRTGVGRDGTLYIPVDVTEVDEATTFVGQAVDYPLAFSAADVAMYNDQGFLMQLLDPAEKGLFEIHSSRGQQSTTLAYWRHEFATYKRDHRQKDRLDTDSPTSDWHRDGSRHIEHDHIVVAIRGQIGGAASPAPGETPPFTLVVESTPAPR